MPTTKPGSRAHRLLGLIGDLVAEQGRGVTTGEIRQAFTDEMGEAPSSLTSEISSLKRRGVLKVAGGRPGHSLYAPADADVERRQREDDDAVIVLEALRSGCQRLGRPLTTREVHEEVRDAERSLDSDNPDGVRRFLQTLARERERGPSETRDRQVLRFSKTTTAGFRANYWAPPDADFGEELVFAPRSIAEAVRRAVHESTDQLGRPISRPELRWWLEWPASDRTVRAKLDLRSLGTALSDTAKADASHRGQPGRVHTIETSFTCHGGPDVRYAPFDPTDVGGAACRLEDAGRVLRVPQELHSLRGLESQVDMGVHPEAVLRVADNRRQLLGTTLRTSVEPVGPKPALERAREAIRTIRTWVGETSLTDDKRQLRRRELRERAASLEAAEAAMRFIRSDDGGLADGIGGAGTVTLDDLDSLLEPSAELLGLPPHRARGLVASARRLPVDSPGGKDRFGNADEQPLSVVDRVDALTALFEAFSVPSANVLIQGAHTLLGHVFRDAAVLRDLLGELPEGASDTRRTVWVALGLLGDAVPLEEAGFNPAGFEDASAWVLAITLADWETAGERVRELDRLALGGVRQLTDMALARLDGGMFVSVIG